VYEDLEAHLLDPTATTPGQPDAKARHVCSVLAGWSYSDTQTVADMMTRLGLEGSRCRMFNATNNAMLIRSTAYLVQSHSGRVALLSYRGTDPFDLSTWAADYDVNPTAIKVPVARTGAQPGSTVHGGFYRNQRSSWYDVAIGLKHAIAGESILADLDPSPRGAEKLRPLEALYVTGHSLGAAMAGIAAFRIATDPEYGKVIWPLVRAVYTFAQPMIGNTAFGQSCGAIPGFIERYFVHVYGRDVVPHLPPLIAAGDFAHFGNMFVSQPSAGKLVEQSTEWVRAQKPILPVGEISQLVAAVLALVKQQTAAPPPLHAFLASLRDAPLRAVLQGFSNEAVDALLRGTPSTYSFYDHTPTYYVACSQPPGVVLTEFGDF
jgi:hypothetical protein